MSDQNQAGLKIDDLKEVPSEELIKLAEMVTKEQQKQDKMRDIKKDFERVFANAEIGEENDGKMSKCD
ncbi:unnamed protein product [Caenorhabditis brenneri]